MCVRGVVGTQRSESAPSRQWDYVQYFVMFFFVVSWRSVCVLGCQVSARRNSWHCVVAGKHEGGERRSGHGRVQRSRSFAGWYLNPHEGKAAPAKDWSVWLGLFINFFLLLPQPQWRRSRSLHATSHQAYVSVCLCVSVWPSTDKCYCVSEDVFFFFFFKKKKRFHSVSLLRDFKEWVTADTCSQSVY